MKKTIIYTSAIVLMMCIFSDLTMHFERTFCIDRSRSLSKALRFSTSVECLEFYSEVNAVEKSISQNSKESFAFSFWDERALLKEFRGSK